MILLQNVEYVSQEKRNYHESICDVVIGIK